MIKDEIYPNSELVEVACGVTFDGNLGVTGNGNFFQKEIKRDYPKLWCPTIKDGDFQGMLPYHFEKNDGTSGIKVSVRDFSFYTNEKSYPGYNNFIKEFNRLIKSFSSLYEIKAFNSVYWRYVDIIPYIKVDNNIPFEKFLKIRLDIPGIKKTVEKMESFDMEFLFNVTKGKVKVKLCNIFSTGEMEREAFLLTTEFSSEGKYGLKEVDKKIEEGHKICKNVFEESITDSYRQYLRGDAIK